MTEQAAEKLRFKEVSWEGHGFTGCGNTPVSYRGIALALPKGSYQGSYQGIALAIPQVSESDAPFRGWGAKLDFFRSLSGRAVQGPEERGLKSVPRIQPRRGEPA